MKISTTLLAAAATGILIGVSGCASAPAATAMDPSAAAPAKNTCKAGQNKCAHQGACKTDKHACNGQNACASQGGGMAT